MNLLLLKLIVKKEMRRGEKDMWALEQLDKIRTPVLLPGDSGQVTSLSESWLPRVWIEDDKIYFAGLLVDNT